MGYSYKNHMCILNNFSAEWKSEDCPRIVLNKLEKKGHLQKLDLIWYVCKKENKTSWQFKPSNNQTNLHLIMYTFYRKFSII
jgi:hypothetical protein